MKLKLSLLLVAITVLSGQSGAAEALDRTILPIPEPVFGGRIGLTPADSEKKLSTTGRSSGRRSECCRHHAG